jgi:vacuolar protein sorting-associated protein 54
MLRDAEHFNSRIGSIDGAGDTGEYIVNLVKEKSISKPTLLAAAPVVNGKASSESKRSTGSKEEGNKSEGKDSEKAS